MVNNYHNQHQKIKTTLCLNYEEDGVCSYGSKCQFAHGIKELRSKAYHLNLYKSKPCRSFFSNGFCPYGLICKFSHKKVTEDD